VNSGNKVYSQLYSDLLSPLIENKQAPNCAKKQKRPVAMSLLQIEEKHSDRNSAIVTAYKTGGYSQREIGEYFRLPLVLWVSLLEKPGVLNSGPDPGSYSHNAVFCYEFDL